MTFPGSSDEVSITILSTAASEGSREAPPSYREDSSRLSREQRQQKAGVLGALWSGISKLLELPSPMLGLLLAALPPSGEPLHQSLAVLWKPSCSVVPYSKQGKCLKSNCEAKISHLWCSQDTLRSRRAFLTYPLSSEVGKHPSEPTHSLLASLVSGCHLRRDTRDTVSLKKSHSRDERICWPLWKGNEDFRVYQP